MREMILVWVILFLFVCVSAQAQHDMGHMNSSSSSGNENSMNKSMTQEDMTNMDHENMEMKALYSSYPMTREASGTSWQPDSSPHEGFHFMNNDWMFMTHGFVNLITSDQS